MDFFRVEWLFVNSFIFDSICTCKRYTTIVIAHPTYITDRIIYFCTLTMNLILFLYISLHVCMSVGGDVSQNKQTT
jgi:hypothetical protein